MWILDVDGERVVIVAWTSSPDPTPANPFAEAMDSITLTKR